MSCCSLPLGVELVGSSVAASWGSTIEYMMLTYSIVCVTTQDHLGDTPLEMWPCMLPPLPFVFPVFVIRHVDAFISAFISANFQTLINEALLAMLYSMSQK